MGAATCVDPLDIACHTKAMEGRPQYERPVHALRHEFKPSHEVTSAIRKFLVPDARQEPLHFFGTKVRLLDLDAFKAHEYDQELDLIKERLSNYERPIYLRGDVGIKPIDTRFARIALRVKDQEPFDTLLNDLNHLPDVRPEAHDGHHWLYTDVAIDALAKNVEARQYARGYLLTAARGLQSMHSYWLSPMRLFEKRGMVPVSELPSRGKDERIQSI